MNLAFGWISEKVFGALKRAYGWFLAWPAWMKVILVGASIGVLMASLGNSALLTYASVVLISFFGHALYLDITASKDSRVSLERANQGLRMQVEDLARHSQEMTVLSELTEMLQASTSTLELCRVVTVFVRQLFKMQSGAIYLLQEPGKVLDATTVWGEPPIVGPKFTPDECWALRRSKPHYEELGSEALFCAHVPRPHPAFSLCLPLMTQGGTMGMLHLRPQDGSGQLHLSESKQLLAAALAQQVALGLSNLRLREFLREDSIRDALTGLYNRRYMTESLDQEVSRADRSGRTVGLITFDLDHFKDINDSQGHAVGDRLLHALGTLVKDSVRAGDIPCRYGGDEFIVILPGISSDQLLLLAELVRKKAESVMPELGGAAHPCTLSVGVAMFPDDGHNAESLQLAADRALYQAKAGGRNRVATASDFKLKPFKLRQP
jgi:diguanylate cyclase (GGDEF)-like protein